MDKRKTVSENIMAHIDALTPAQRKLVHEYGFVAVENLRDAGIGRAREMEPILKHQRLVRQDESLSAIPYHRVIRLG